MPWANLDDQYAEHPDNWGLSDAAFRLHTAAICYANMHLTDGEIPKTKVRTLVPKFRASALAELTEDHWIDKDGVYEIRNFLKWNRSKVQVEAERQRKSNAGKKGAESRWHKP